VLEDRLWCRQWFFVMVGQYKQILPLKSMGGLMDSGVVSSLCLSGRDCAFEFFDVCGAPHVVGFPPMVSAAKKGGVSHWGSGIYQPC